MRRRRGPSAGGYPPPWGMQRPPRYRTGPPPGYGYGYRQPVGGSCLRDACLLETGCCLAEGLDGTCLLSLVLVAPQLLGALVAPVGSGGRLRSAIAVYRTRISPRRPAVCRFEPSCSAYADEAIAVHGAARGSLLAARRLLRCRPGGRRGLDPVPPPRY